MDDQFINKLSEILETNVENEHFGVSELAKEMGMSRSNLHRKIITASKISANQYIRQFRLQKGMEMLKQTSFTVSEVSYKVGFSSPAYFIKCFHDYYGYSPGEVGNRKADESEEENYKKPLISKKRLVTILISAIAVIVLATILFIVLKPFSKEQTEPEKTIAVMPFEDYTGEENNVNIADGLLTDIINNLNNIENIKVVPRSTVNNYKNSTKSNQLIAKELMVNYLLYGSVHHLGNRIKINLELIEALSDTSVWNETYFRDIGETDIEKLFEIQENIAIKVASILKIRLTEKEEEKIFKKPTENQAALAKYNLGMLHLQLGNSNTDILQSFYEWNEAKKLLKEAIKLDTSYSDAYENLGWLYHTLNSYTFIDIYSADRYLDSALLMVDKSLKYKPNNVNIKLLQYLIYMRKGIFDEAEKINVTFPEEQIKNYGYYQSLFEKYYMIEDFYNTINSFYTYQLKKPEDILTPVYLLRNMVSYLSYLGYHEEAIKTAEELLKQYGDSTLYLKCRLRIEVYSGNYKKFLEYNNSWSKTDSTSTDFLDLAMFNSVMLRDYKNAFQYLQLLENAIKNSVIPVRSSYLYLFGYIYLKNGLVEESEYQFENAIKIYQDEINLRNLDAQGRYSNIKLAAIYSALGEKETAFKYLKELKKCKINYKIFILNLENNPMFDNIRGETEFVEISISLITKYQKEHNRVGELLRELGGIE